MTEQQELICHATLNQIFSEDWFSICKITPLCEMLNISQATQEYKNLAALHCIHYNKLSPMLKRELPAMIKKALRATDKEWENIVNPKWIIEETDGTAKSSQPEAAKAAPVYMGWKRIFNLGFGK